MMSREYWKDRVLENDARRRKSEDRSIHRIRKAFVDCEEILTSRIEAFYAKYGKDGKVTPQEARKLLDRAELAAFRRRMASLAEVTFGDKFSKEVRVLRARVNISRQEALLAEIRLREIQLANSTLAEMTQALESVYREQESHSRYNFEQSLHIGVDFSRFSDVQLESLLHVGYDGKDFSSKMWYDTEKLVQHLNLLIPRAILIGSSVEVLSRELSREMNTPRYTAERLIRTEGAFLASQADMRLYSLTGLDRYEFLATLDTRTSEICIALDGQVFPLSQAAVGVNLPPMHPNCRSTTLPVLDDDLESMRLAKDVDGKYISIPKQSYADWARRPEGEYVREKYYASVKKYYSGPSKETVEYSVSKVRLPNGNMVDLTQEKLTQYGYSSIDEYRQTYMDTVKRLLPETTIGVRVRANTLPELLKDGVYRANSYSRKMEEQLLFGIADNAPLAAYPVYGALMTPEELEKTKFDPKSRYGDQVIVLKRGMVEDRTTFTLGDSLNNSRCVVPTPLRSPNSRTIAGIQEHDIVKEASTLTEISARRFTVDQYAEAQIAGGFSLSEIDYIRLTAPPDPALSKLLKEKGVAWKVLEEDR